MSVENTTKKTPLTHTCTTCGNEFYRIKRHTEKSCARILREKKKIQRQKDQYEERMSWWNKVSANNLCQLSEYTARLFTAMGWGVTRRWGTYGAPYGDKDKAAIVSRLRGRKKVLSRRKRLEILRKAFEDPSFKEVLQVDLEMADQGKRRSWYLP